jgi:hypothetical protein
MTGILSQPRERTGRLKKAENPVGRSPDSRETRTAIYCRRACRFAERVPQSQNRVDRSEEFGIVYTKHPASLFVGIDVKDAQNYGRSVPFLRAVPVLD